jgi:hypothetical protein
VQKKPFKPIEFESRLPLIGGLHTQFGRNIRINMDILYGRFEILNASQIHHKRRERLDENQRFQRRRLHN